MNGMYFATVFLWFLTGAWFALAILPWALEWIRGYNKRYAVRLAHFFRDEKNVADPARIRRFLVLGEVGGFVGGTVLSMNPIFGLWGLGFAIFAVQYVAKLLEMRDLEKFDGQMLDVVQTMKNSLKAGMTLQQAMQMIATEFQEPAREQFSVALREIQIGASIEEALHHLEERVPNSELKMMVNAIEILRQTGGNMVETFDTLAETLKNRKRVEGKIKSLTAQGRIQAIILCAMPFVMALILYFLSREYIQPLFNTILGWVILTIVLMLVSTGWVIIKKVITIEV